MSLTCSLIAMSFCREAGLRYVREAMYVVACQGD
jgi:hypothetical protein